MNAFPKIDTMEALRLTRDGRLQEALAVLSGGLPSPAPSNSEGDGPRRPTGRTATILDMVPPRPGIGGAWTAPQFSTAPSPGRPGAMTRPQMPEALRGFMDRIGHLGHVDGIDGLVGPAVGRAPVPLPDGARFEERTYANQAGSRAYKLYVPSGYTGQALPLVVMLHGCTQSPDDFAAGTQMNELAEEQTFLVAYPAQPKSANMSKCWNWFNEGEQQRDRGEPSLIAGITRQIMRDFPVEPGRVFIAGLSAGGAAAAIMGSTYPDLYAAIGVHSGLACGAARDMPSAFAAMRQGGMPVAAGSRESDEVFRPSCSTVIATRPSAPSTATRSLPRRRRRQICGRVSAMARLLAESATPAPFRRTRAGVRCSSNGYFTEPATHGPAAARPAHIRSHAGLTPAAR